MTKIMLSGVVVLGIFSGILMTYVALEPTDSALTLETPPPYPESIQVAGILTSRDTETKKITILMVSPYLRSERVPVQITYNDQTTLRIAPSESPLESLASVDEHRLGPGTRVLVFVAREPGPLRADMLVVPENL
ncbi:hypothetical protein K8R03_02730 [Candidatus Kaiserbacteria bacterium]|nr:hypothetical protein [Candidatus Kaiserbacteria bacterium]